MGGLSPTYKKWEFFSWGERTDPDLNLLYPLPSRDIQAGKIFPTFDMGVSKNRGTPKWMVRMMENPIF